MKQSKNTESDKHKSSAMLWFWIPVAIVGFAAMSGVFLCRYEPRAYRPVLAADTDEVSPYLTHELGPDFFNQVQLDDPFELRVEQKGLNDIISRWGWPQQYGDLIFTDPMIMFGEGSIYLMGTLKYKKISSVVTIIAFPVMDDEGKLNLNIQSVRLGVLPITTLAGKISQTAFDQSKDCFEGEPPHLEGMVQAIITNEGFDPIFEISEHQARIENFSLEPGELTILFNPE